MRSVRSLSCLLALAAPLAGQTCAEKLAEAVLAVEAGQWREAFELLLPLAAGEATNGELQQIANRFCEVGDGFMKAGATEAALRGWEAALATRRRAYGDSDHPEVAATLNNIAYCLEALGRASEALSRHEAALEMQKRLHPDGDHPGLALGHNNVAVCLESVGRADEALQHYEAALAMWTRMHRDHDDREVAIGLNNVAACLESLGRPGEALPRFEAALAMWSRVHRSGDHPEVAMGINNVAACLQELGRVDEALPRFETALAMRRRLYRDRDHPDVAMTSNNVASCLWALGRAQEALPQLEATLAMRERLHGDRDHPDVALSRNNLATCLMSLGRASEALPQMEAVLAARRRMHGDIDHPDVAASLNSVGFCLKALGRAEEASTQQRAALAMVRRLHGDRDHPDVATYLNNLAFGLETLGRWREALPQFEAALAMRRRLYGDRDHPDVVTSLNGVADCLQALGRAADAVAPCAEACEMIERLRGTNTLSAQLKQSFFDDLKRGGSFERLQALQRDHAPAQALAAAERSRGRDLLDSMAQRRFDPLAEAEQQAARRGDQGALESLQRLRTDLANTVLESDRLLHDLAKLEDTVPAAEQDARRVALIARSNANTTRLRQLQDERARVLLDVLPMGQVRAAGEIRSALADGELLLEFTVTEKTSLLYLLSRDTLDVLEIPTAHAVARRHSPALLARCSREQLPMRGRDPEKASTTADAAGPGLELFSSLIPAAAWTRIRSANHVFIAAHRSLHRLPFELLVTAIEDGKPVYWLDSGPPISYVPSGSALHWLRKRSEEHPTRSIDPRLLAIGDPGGRPADPAVPEAGAFITAVPPEGQGARIGLLPGDVLLSYDGNAVVDDTTIGIVRERTDAAIGEGRRANGPIPIEVWRRGEVLRLELAKGPLGIQVGRGKARMAFEASLGNAAQLERFVRAGDLERIQKLPPLAGARAETEAITRAWIEKGHTARRLVGPEATESAVFERALDATFLHFACHGVAEEYAGQSLSTLVLNYPEHVQPDDDGLLKLDDLFNRWRGRLDSCELVVLSACRTNVGEQFRDEAPQALPLGFLFAGARSVISSLWAVDDASTKALMTDFYERLLAGEKDRLKAFTAAKKALRAKYVDPFHWAPFLYMGSPD